MRKDCVREVVTELMSVTVKNLRATNMDLKWVQAAMSGLKQQMPNQKTLFDTLQRLACGLGLGVKNFAHLWHPSMFEVAFEACETPEDLEQHFCKFTQSTFLKKIDLLANLQSKLVKSFTWSREVGQTRKTLWSKLTKLCGDVLGGMTDKQKKTMWEKCAEYIQSRAEHEWTPNHWLMQALKSENVHWKFPTA